MAKAKLDIARASKEELLSFCEDAEITVDPSLSLPQLREKALEIQQTLSASNKEDDIERRAKAASAAILGDEDEELESDDTQAALTGLRAGAPKKARKTFDIDSLEVQPEDGEAASINAIIDDSRNREDGESVEERILREQMRKKDDYRTARFVAAADAEINEYHRAAAQEHNAKITNICFFLKKGMHLSSFTTPYTKIQGVRLRKDTPYRALDLELKFFRRKRGMFGECAYEGADQAVVKKAKK